MFYGRTITAATWDGKTKYDIKETAEEEAKRLAEWAKFLGEEEEMANKATNKLTDTEMKKEASEHAGQDESKDEEGSAGKRQKLDTNIEDKGEIRDNAATDSANSESEIQ